MCHRSAKRDAHTNRQAGDHSTGRPTNPRGSSPARSPRRPGLPKPATTPTRRANSRQEISMNAVVTRDENMPVQQVSEESTLLSIISHAASNPAVDIDKMERLMEMHERVQKRQAAAAF